MRDKRTRKALRKYRQYDAKNWQKYQWQRVRRAKQRNHSTTGGPFRGLLFGEIECRIDEVNI